MTEWDRVLDAFEARLVEQRAALDRGEAGDLAPFDPPVDAGPLPLRLAGRARDLLAHADDLVIELRDNTAALKQELTVVRTLEASTGRSAGARFIDTSA